MQIVIDIPNNMLKAIKENGEGTIGVLTKELFGILMRGTPLPKGHGDLIDRDDLLADSYCIDDWAGNEVDIVDVMTVKIADAIIEADKSESEE